MQIARIYHISSQRSLPVEVGIRGGMQIESMAIAPEDLAGLRPKPDELSLLLVEMEAGAELSTMKSVSSRSDLNDLPKLLLCPASSYRSILSAAALSPRTYLLDDSVRPEHLRLTIELLLGQEHYRFSVRQLANEARNQRGAFENVLEMARRELQSAREEHGALRALLEYEAQAERFHHGLQEALEQANSLRDRELVSLKGQLEASERLSQFRDQELREARSVANATEAALDLSREESLEREKLITALDRLRSLTDRELMDLVRENELLRQKLGLPARQA
ncbi:MAG: hypothetical protein K1X75_04115 [Leptospirales bacterium]|nr:hypothetical protein [Leptospirales bacterium]